MPKKIDIKIEKISQGGFCPFYWKDDYPEFGNSNMASDMTNIDLMSANYLTQGPGLDDLTDGTESGNLSSNVKSMLQIPASSDTIYGIGGNKVYTITSSEVSSSHTVDNGSETGETGEDVEIYSGELFYSYNHDSGGDIGKFDLSSNWDDDWWTDSAGGTKLTDNPHPMIVAGTSGVLYIGNGQYVAEWDGSTAYHDSFNTTDSDSTIVDLAWNQNRLWIAANKPDLSGDNKSNATIYAWDGNSDSWESAIRMKGKVGALYNMAGTLFVFYQDNLSENLTTIAYVNGTQVEDIASYEGEMPEHNQVTEYQKFIMWSAGGEIYAWGAGDKNVDARMFQFADAGYDTSGGISNAFGTPLVASTDGSSSYRVAKFDGYDTNSEWKSKTFNLQEESRNSHIDSLWIWFEKLKSGAEVDITLRNNEGTAFAEKTISYSDDGAVSFKRFGNLGRCKNFRIEFDFSNGSTSNPVKIKGIQLYGRTTEK